MRTVEEITQTRDIYIGLRQQAIDKGDTGGEIHTRGIIHALTWVLHPELETPHDVSRAVNILLGYIEA